MKIPDLINELFESREMSEYLIEHFAELSKYNILRMVCSAPIDIRRKAEILLELSKDENIEKEIAEELKEKEKLLNDKKKEIENNILFKTIKSMLENNIDNETISKITNLSIEEIIKIKNSL